MKTGIYLLGLIFALTTYLFPNKPITKPNNCEATNHYVNYSGCSSDNYNIIIEGITYDKNNPIDTIILTNESGCDSTIYISLEFESLSPELLPPVGIHKTNLSSENTNDGSIHFEFENEPNQDSLEFSIDGGLTFPYLVADHSETFVIHDLAADTFHVKARWQGMGCMLELGKVQLIPDPCGSYQLSDSIPNILFIVADDFGLEAAPFSSLDSEKANMPVLENLVSQGLVFDNAWAAPSCAPTRAGIITGRHGFRTGVLSIPTNNTLGLEETTIQKYIDTTFPNRYEQAIIGKWHLNNEIVDYTYPAKMGIPHFDGLRRGSTGSYYNWQRQTNGVLQEWDQYITTAITDASSQWIEDQGEKPWHLWVTHIAPHKPFHKPPNHLHTRDSLIGSPEDIIANPVPYYIAMLESLDKEIGRLLDNMCPNVKDNTTIVFISDNGTPLDVL